MTTKARTVGETVKAKHVVRPDGGEFDIEGGVYVLDVPGVHVIDGDEVTVK